MVKTHFSSDDYHRCVMSQMDEIGNVKPFAPYAMRVPSEKVFISRLVEQKSRKRDYSVQLARCRNLQMLSGAETRKVC